MNQQPPVNWAGNINASIQGYAANVRNRPYVMRRVPQEVRELNPKHYEATVLPIGLFNRTFDSLTTRAELCKVAMASAVLEEIAPITWNELCALVVRDPEEILAHYEVDWQPPSSNEVPSVLTLDAVFVAVYLGTSYHSAFRARFPSLNSAALLEKRELSRIASDLLKVENQIPLALIREALRALVRNSGTSEARAMAARNDALVKDVLSVIIGVIVPQFRIPGYDANDSSAAMRGLLDNLNLDSCLYPKHFLDVAYRATIRKMGDDTREEDNVLAAPILMRSAKELRKAGIKFEGRTGVTEIEFNANAGTIYLPTLIIDRGSERVWKNLVAYEQMSSFNQDAFLHYLKFMDRLIDTEDDVMLLRSGKFPTIVNINLGSNKEVAELFNTVLQNTYASPHRRWGELYQQIHQYYDQTRRQHCEEFKEIHCNKPWLCVSFIIAIVLFISTLLQTYFTIAEYYPRYYQDME